jgi:probable phosphoglycerate mutase
VRDEDIAVIVASPLARARQTAAIVAESVGLPVLVRDGVREISAGEFELRGDEDAIARYRDVTFAWVAGRLDVTMPAGDTGREVLEHFDEVIHEAARSTPGPRAALVISHGAAIRTWVASRAHNVEIGFLRDRSLPNAGLVVLEGGNQDGWQVLSWNGLVLTAGTPVGGDRP